MAAAAAAAGAVNEAAATTTVHPSRSALGEPPAVSLQTIAVTGILCDVFGLEELPPTKGQNKKLTNLSVLWLHNPRLGDRARMHPMARRAVSEYNRTKPANSTRGLIAVAFGELNIYFFPPVFSFLHFLSFFLFFPSSSTSLLTAYYYKINATMACARYTTSPTNPGKRETRTTPRTCLAL